MSKRKVIVHTPCGKSVEKCKCKDAEVSVLKSAKSSTDLTRDMEKALNYCRKRFNADKALGLFALDRSAGFILPPRFLVGKCDRTGYQVFVRVARYDEKLLKLVPRTGGLLVHATNKEIAKVRKARDEE